MTNKIIQGDLVDFYSTVDSFMSDYSERNPGVVLAARPPKSFLNASKNIDKGSAYILWSDGTMTKEHISYLRKLQK